MADVGIKITAVDQASAVFGKVSDEAGKFKNAVDSVGSGFAALSTVAITALSAISFATKIKDVIDLADSFNKLSQKTGIAVDSLSKLNYAAGLSDVSTETLAKGMRSLNLSISEAAGGNKDKAAIFQALGVSIKDASGQVLSADAVFSNLSDVMAASADGANKVAVGSAVMGKSFVDLIPLVNAGKSGLQSMGDEATKLGVVIGADFARDSEEFNDNLAKLKLAGQGLFITLGHDLVKGLGESAAAMANAALEGGKLSAVMAGLNTLIFGTDQHMSDVKLVEQTELMLSLEKSLTVARKNGNAAYIKSREDALAAVNAEIKTTMSYRKVLQDLEETKKAATKPKPTTDSKTIIKAAGLLAKSGNEKKDTANAFAGEQDAAKEWAKAMEAAGKASAELTAKNLGLSKSEAELKNYIESTAAALNDKTNPAMNDMVRAAYEATIELEKLSDARKAIFDAVENQQKKTSTAQDETAKERERVAAIGLTTAAVAELTATRLEEMATAKERTLLATDEIDLSGAYSESIKEEVAALRERAGLMRTGATKEAGIETAKQVAAEWQRGWQSADQIAREVFADWAVNGASAAKTIGDTLKKALLSAIYEATLKPLVFQVYTSLTGGAGSVGGTAAQLASGGSSIQSLFGGAGTLFSQGFGAGISSVFGESGILGGLSAGTTAIGAGNIAGGVGTLAGVAAPFLAGTAALIALADAMKYTVTPAGGAIVANLTGGQSTAVANRSDFVQTGGFLGGGTTNNSSWADADPATTKYINAQATAMHDAASTYAAAIGLSSASLDAYTAQITINTTGMDAATAQAAINAELVRYTNDSIAASYGTTLSAVAKDGETSSATLARLASSLSTVNDWATLFGTTLQDISITGAAAASTLIEAFGGLDKLNASLGTYYQNYYTEAEQRARTIADVRTSLSTAGIDLSIAQLEGATKEGIRAWVDVAKALYDAGIYTASQLATVINAANRMAPIAGQAPTQGQVDAAYEQARHDWAVAHPWEDAAGDFLNKDGTVTKGGLWAGSGGGGGGLGASIDGAGTDDGWKNSIKSWLDKMNSTDSGIDSINRARDVAFASYKTQLSLAQGGDATARQNITGFADTFIDSIKNSSKTLLEEQLGIARVKEQVGGLLGEKKPEVLITDAIIKSGDGVVTAIRRLGDMLGDPGNPGGSGSGSQPIAVPIANAPPRAPANASGDRAAAAQIAAMAEALAKMERRLESIDVNTREGAKSARNTYTVLDEATNGARSLQTVAG